MQNDDQFLLFYFNLSRLCLYKIGPLRDIEKILKNTGGYLEWNFEINHFDWLLQ